MNSWGVAWGWVEIPVCQTSAYRWEVVFLKHGKGCTPQSQEVLKRRLPLQKEGRSKIKGAKSGSGELPPK